MFSFLTQKLYQEYICAKKCTVLKNLFKKKMWLEKKYLTSRKMVPHSYNLKNYVTEYMIEIFKE